MTTRNQEDELKKADYNFKPLDLRELVLQMQRDLVHYMKYIEIQTQLMRHRYDNLIKQGFDKKQAERLCKYGLENPGVQ